MRRLGNKFTIVLVVGGLGVLLALCGAAAGEDVLAFAGLALALLGVLGAQAWHRLDVLRLRDLSSGRRESNPVSPSSPPQIDEQFYVYRRIAEDTEQIALTSVAELSRRIDSVVNDVSAEVAAILQLTEGQTETPIIRSSDPVRATQVVEVIAILKARSARRVLTVGVGVANHWLAREISESSGQMVAIFDEAAPDTAEEMLRLKTLLQSRETVDSVQLSTVGRAVPGVDGAYLEWFDLSEISESEAFDAVVLAANSDVERRAALPALDLLDSRISADGCIMFLDQAVPSDVARAWSANARWRAMTRPESMTVFTRES